MTDINILKKYRKYFANLINNGEEKYLGYLLDNDTEFKNDEEFILEMIKDVDDNNNPIINVGYLFDFISEDLLYDIDFSIKVVKINGCYLEHLDHDMRDDEEVVFEAVKNNRNAFKFASRTIKEVYETVDKFINSYTNN